MAETGKRFCTNCGAEMDVGLRFCTACGTPLEPLAPPASIADIPVESPPQQPYSAHGDDLATIITPAVEAPVTPPKKSGVGKSVGIGALVGLLVAGIVVGVLFWQGIIGPAKAPTTTESSQSEAEASGSESTPTEVSAATTQQTDSQHAASNPTQSSTQSSSSKSTETSNPANGASTNTYDSIASQASSKQRLDLEFVSSDVSNYPTVKAYYTIRDLDGNDVSFNGVSVAIKEGIGSGKELERKIKSFEQLKGHEGVSFGLLADKSASMDQDIGRMKDILSQFISALDYKSGDQAELISFDSFVMHMCTYTNDPTLLQNGVFNMETYGNTALYDALYEGLVDARYQNGARCVIAFTDGMDNESHCSPQDIISLATSYNIPVFIIGTGGADEYTLRQIAEGTNGEYWDIASISDMAAILERISAGEKNMYCLEYESDANSAADAARTLSIAVMDGSYGASLVKSFTPVLPEQREKHDSRYELVKADVSWTEANAACIAKGGHLVTINSQEEMTKMSAMAEEAGLVYSWIGGYTSNRGNLAFGHWVTGEPFDYQAWYPGEPSRNDRDGTPEMYLILWKVKGEWSWNDERDAPFESSDMKSMRGKMGYICEYEDVQ
ncbi:MAG: VWA domain-containing protein [Atopobiaceae bacterium]|nr:VWA domain-containing protein [Atopobiaceae bacterium]